MNISSSQVLRGSWTLPTFTVIPMIKLVLGVENAEEILGVLGVLGLSGAFVGPVNLWLSMGFSGAHGEEDEDIAALERIFAAGGCMGLPVGLFVSCYASQQKSVYLRATPRLL